ncbi:MAG: GNAT family N-acetyltransferase [Pseudomonadales bacterium]|nr:GNAT family N-acetyltransferase [Pseudomonadales bacterium]
MSELTGRYPRDVELANETVELSLLSEADREDLLAFARSLPAHDLLFLSRDIREPKVQGAWLRQIEAGEIVSIVARAEGKIVGTTAVVIDRLSFSAHVGELRILVAGGARHKGLGRKLIQEAFMVGVDQGLEKLTARMTLDQDAAIAVFEELGFIREAMFRDHVKDAEGKKHDVLVMSQDVEAFYGQKRLYGLDEAL